MRLIWTLIVVSLVTTAASASAETTAEVDFRRSAAGATLFDVKGAHLYTYDADVGPISKCVGACVNAWPPLEASANAVEDANLKIQVRADGRRQWVYKDKPLYKFARDAYPGARMGEIGTSGWRIAFDPAPTPAGMSIRRAPPGWVLANVAGVPLVTPTARQKDPSKIVDREWVPVRAPTLAQTLPDWSIIVRSDGIRQWAYRDQPLFTSADGVTTAAASNTETFRLVVLEQLPAKPSWVTVQTVDTGDVLADQNGMTLYVVRNMQQVVREKTCLEECMQTYWRRVPAAADAQPVGNWSLVEVSGQKVWAFMGAQVFTHTRDSKPGDSMGFGFGVGQGIGGGWRPISVNQLVPAVQ